jgi:hypothetical protein
VAILAILTKKKIVNAQSTEKHTKKELCIDVIRLSVVYVTGILACLLIDKSFSIGLLLIDLFMLAVYLIPFLQKTTISPNEKPSWGYCPR